MSKAPRIPIFGEPVYRISANNFSEKIKVVDASMRHSINELQYFAVDAIKVVRLEYEDDACTTLLINGGTDSEIKVKVDKLDAKEKDSYSIFIDLAEANAVAARMNTMQKQNCKVILDNISQIYHEYDNIIASLK